MSILKRVLVGKSGSKAINGAMQEIEEKMQIANKSATVPPASAVASTGTLTVATIASAGDTMKIGGMNYIFTIDETAAEPGEIDIGADVAGTKINIAAAINGTDGIHAPHPGVTAGAFSGNDLTLTATVKGVVGNVPTTETFTAPGNVFTASTLTGGVDGTVPGALFEMRVVSTKLYVHISGMTAATAVWQKATLS